MKKSILFVAALLCGAMVTFAEEGVISMATNDDLAPQLGWVNETSYPNFNFNEYISVGCVNTTGTNGVFYATAKAAGDWRLYQARSMEVVGTDTLYGRFWIKANKGAKITGLQLTYSTNYTKGGGLISTKSGVNITDSIASDSVMVFEQGVDSIALFAGTSAGKYTAQVRIQAWLISYTYEPSALKETGVEQKAKKVVREGQLYIRKGDKEYNVLGF